MPHPAQSASCSCSFLPPSQSWRATGPTGTVLLRTSASSGHGFGTSLSEAIEQEVDVYAFMFHQLGVEYCLVSHDGGAARSLR